GGRMRIDCDSCRKEFSLPEEKLPDAQRFRIKCPSCGNRISVERPADQTGGEGTSGDQSLESEAMQSGEEDFAGLTPIKDNNGLILFKDPDLLEAVRDPLEGRGYRVAATSSSGEARRIFSANPLSLVVLEDVEENLPMLRDIHSQPGFARREINCVLVGDQARSLDTREAFIRGVNTYLSSKDRDRFGELLSHALGKYSQFIHPWLLAKGEV
ncbi:MAG: zinc-ribbon domain-containing protein, partial [Desulfohalobiaceae bacterium]